MKTLTNYIVAGALYDRDTGPEAMVGDQVNLYLDTVSNSGFPEYIVGTIQHPIVKVQCNTATSYSIEYDPADLNGAADLIHPDDVVSSQMVSDVDVIAAALNSEIATRGAADTAESGARTAADVVLQANIDAEAAARISADLLIDGGTA